jgi:hypothetical protein
VKAFDRGRGVSVKRSDPISEGKVEWFYPSLTSELGKGTTSRTSLPVREKGG